MILEPLILKGGVHTLAIRLFNDFRNKRTVLIDVTDDCTHTIDLDGDWVEESESACFYVDAENVDTIIEKLQEAKKYLNNEPVEIEDGFGSTWSIQCPECKNETMQVVRPGKVQCSKCQ